MGSYSYVDSTGVNRVLKYKAGAGTGFVAEADFIPTTVQIDPTSIFGSRMTSPVLKAKPQTVGYSAKVENPVKFYSRPEKKEPTPAAPLPIPTQVYTKPAPPPVPSGLYAPPAQIPKPKPVVVAPIQPAEPVVEVKVAPAPQEQSDIFYQTPTINQNDWTLNPDWAFGYSASHGQRQEFVNAAGNIEGSYTIPGANGQPIEVRYISGPEIGFVIENLEEVMAASVPNDDEAVAYHQQQQIGEQPVAPARRPQPVVQVQTSQPQEQSDIFYQTPTINQNDWTLNPDWAFGYSASHGQRQEYVNGQGNVQGSYTIPGANGQSVEVRYTAGPTIGFVIENLQEVQAASVPANDPAAEINAQAYQQQQQQQQQFAPIPQPGVQQQRFQSRPIPVNPISIRIPQQQQQPQQYHQEEEESIDYDSLPADRTYSFKYEGESSNRQESSDADGNIQGQYSYINAEGNEIIVKYSASPYGGFVIENSQELTKSVEKATLDGAATVAQTKSLQQEQHNRQDFVPVARVQPDPPARPTTRRRKVVKKRKRVQQQQQQQQQQPESFSYKIDLPPATPDRLYAAPPAPVQDVRKLAQPVQDVEPGAEPEGQDFEFSFKAEDGSSRHEKADENGERVGSYSYVDSNGEVVVVNYRAGVNGFEIL